MHRHLPAFTQIFLIREQLVHKLFQRKTAIAQGALLPVLRHNHILIAQCGSTADRGRFFP